MFVPVGMSASFWCITNIFCKESKACKKSSPPTSKESTNLGRFLNWKHCDFLWASYVTSISGSVWWNPGLWIGGGGHYESWQSFLGGLDEEQSPVFIVTLQSLLFICTIEAPGNDTFVTVLHHMLCPKGSCRTAMRDSSFMVNFTIPVTTELCKLCNDTITAVVWLSDLLSWNRGK